MAYKRKTEDEYRIMVDYSQGYEEATCETTWRAGRAALANYRKNCPEYQKLFDLLRI